MISATKKWLFLKVSGAILVPLMIWFIINFVSIYDQGYLEIVSFFTSKTSKILFCIFIITAFFSQLLVLARFLRIILVNDKMKNVANKLLYFSAVVIPLITIILINSL